MSKHTNTFFRASYETSHFEFEAYGLKEVEARKALVAGLREHTKQYGLLKDWFAPDDINNESFSFGIPYRDSEPINDDYEDPNDYAGMGWVGQDGRP